MRRMVRTRIVLVTSAAFLGLLAVVGAVMPRTIAARALTFAVDIMGPTEVAPGDPCVFWASPSGGTPPYTYEWTAAGQTSSSYDITYTASANQSGYWVTLVMRDANNQMATDAQYVQVSTSAPSPCPF